MKPEIYIAAPIPPQVEEFLRRHCIVRKWEGDTNIPYPHLLREVGNAQGLIVRGSPRIDREVLEAAPRLRIVSSIAVGYNNFDIAAMKDRHVMGTNTAGVPDDSVADLVFGLILAVARRISELDSYVKAGRWQKGDITELFGRDVHHATLGIIGMGRIGEAIARRGRWGFNMEVLYHNRTRKEEAERELGARYRTLDELLQESDFIVVMTPLTAETGGFIGWREFCLMKKTAVFINASRGRVIDEDALVRALREGIIYGAGLDVYAKEPLDPAHPLLTLSNVVTLPHIGVYTEKTLYDMAMCAAENLIKGLHGEKPPNLVKELKEQD